MIKGLIIDIALYIVSGAGILADMLSGLTQCSMQPEYCRIEKTDLY